MITADFTNVLSDNITALSGLHQWDRGQELVIQGLHLASPPNIHFATKGSDNALVVTSTQEVLGVIKATIPDKILQSKHNVIAYIVEENGLEVKVIKTILIPITQRAKPSNYRETNSAIIREVNNLVKTMLESLYELQSNYDTFRSIVLSYDIPSLKSDVADALNQLSEVETGLSNSVTRFSADGKTITENGANGHTVTVFNDDGSITETNTKNGVTKVMDVFFDADGTIREVIRE